MSAMRIEEQFDGIGDALPVSAQDRAVRRSALERFAELGLPSRRLESWHYTDLTSLDKTPFRFLPQTPDAAALQNVAKRLAEIPLAEGRSRWVFVDGRWSESLSSPRSQPGLEMHLGEPQLSGDTPATALAALNTAFAAEGAWIHVTEPVPSPIELVFIGTGGQLASQFRLRIALEARARASVVLRFVDLPNADAAWLNLVTDIEQHRDSQLALYRLQAHSSVVYQTTLNRARLAAGARLMAGNFELGGKLVRNEFDIGLTGEGASADVYGITLTAERQHADTRIVVDHRAPDTTSRQNHRAILSGMSRSVFNGKVVVQPKAQHIDARQRTDNLLLSRGAEADAKPELEIYADQVICSHGATVGELDEDHLFYLRARGLDEATARGLLTQAFADAILDRVALEDFREDVRESVRRRLPGTVELT